MFYACTKILLAMVIRGFLFTGSDGCGNGYYMGKEGCKLCSINCSSCLSESSCTSCKVGHHGISCSLLCPDSCHDKECNKTTGLCLSCKTGYFSNEGGSCIECPQNCTTCKSSKFCFACKGGYKGEYCQDICYSCENDSRCDKNTGYCLDSCLTGFSGELCDIRCDSKCTSCDRLNQFECNSCAHDRYGLNCDEICSLNCFNKKCNNSDGVCVAGCESGYWGRMCNNTCWKFCKDSVCNVTDGGCLKGQVYINTASNSATTSIVVVCVISIVAIAIFIVRCTLKAETSSSDHNYQQNIEQTDDAKINDADLALSSSPRDAYIKIQTFEKNAVIDGRSQHVESDADSTSSYHMPPEYPPEQ